VEKKNTDNTCCFSPSLIPLGKKKKNTQKNWLTSEKPSPEKAGNYIQNCTFCTVYMLRLSFSVRKYSLNLKGIFSRIRVSSQWDLCIDGKLRFSWHAELRMRRPTSRLTKWRSGLCRDLGCFHPLQPNTSSMWQISPVPRQSKCLRGLAEGSVFEESVNSNFTA